MSSFGISNGSSSNSGSVWLQGRRIGTLESLLKQLLSSTEAEAGRRFSALAGVFALSPINSRQCVGDVHFIRLWRSAWKMLKEAEVVLIAQVGGHRDLPL
jgi:hypothetical protein